MFLINLFFFYRLRRLQPEIRSPFILSHTLLSVSWLSFQFDHKKVPLQSLWRSGSRQREHHEARRKNARWQRSLSMSILSKGIKKWKRFVAFWHQGTFYFFQFFLRLNYLEMHRTYGCSANPQRARPLCDFCGRKFCQPQKLKVHIKRMHSDMAEVLRDFQCKLCSKLLGSRAALQRHSKEVHSRNSAVVSCPRCQKLFQNRSNLKIHMLTHSGVRPFK